MSMTTDYEMVFNYFSFLYSFCYNSMLNSHTFLDQKYNSKKVVNFCIRKSKFNNGNLLNWKKWVLNVYCLIIKVLN